MKKLSVAILQALDDLELCMNDVNYIIDFNLFHHPIDPIKDQFKNIVNKKCAVCFAGSIIAKRLKPNEFNEDIRPSDFNKKTENMLLALDQIRSGSIIQALYQLGIYENSENFKNVVVNQHDYNIFKSQMIEISNMLKKNKY
jgi:hypothetical protein